MINYHKVFLCALLFLVLVSCTSKDVSSIYDQSIEKKIDAADSLFTAGNAIASDILLKKIRAHISGAYPLICRYYILKANQIKPDKIKMEKYADSALVFFSSHKRIKNNEDQYVQLMLIKGDVRMIEKKYHEALDYYYRAKVLLKIKSNAFNSSNFSSKMATLYFRQNKFSVAASYWTESYRWLEKPIAGMSKLQIFYNKQAALNNAGYSFENANLTDSAMFYYKKGLSYVDEMQKEGNIDTTLLNCSRLVFCDNIGSLYLKKNDFVKAESYLKKSIALDSHLDGAIIPPLIKLASLYLKKGDYARSDDAFKKSRTLLDNYKNQNVPSEVKWQNLRSDFYFKRGRLAEAYQSLQNYIHIKDSVEHSAIKLYEVDLENEFKSFQQDTALADLVKKDQLTRLYLVILIAFLIMLSAIALLVNKNLTYVKKNNKETNKHNLELQKTLSELELANQNYIRIMRVMAHDLKNPLSGMTGLVTVMLDDDNLCEDYKHMLKLIESTGVHSLEMINELLKSGLADEREQLLVERIDLQALLQDSVELLRFRAAEKRQTITFDIIEETVWARVNQEKIWRVFNNLIVNAIKFSPNGSNIQVALQKKAKSLLISVADNGIGIPEADKLHIFEMFSQAKKAGTNGEEPFGLGLSISKKIIEKHGGKIWFEDNENSGTIFFIELPS